MWDFSEVIHFILCATAVCSPSCAGLTLLREQWLWAHSPTFSQMHWCWRCLYSKEFRRDFIANQASQDCFVSDCWILFFLCSLPPPPPLNLKGKWIVFNISLAFLPKCVFFPLVPASSAVPGIGPSLQKPFQEYLEAQRQKLHHRREAGTPQVRFPLASLPWRQRRQGQRQRQRQAQIRFGSSPDF